GTLFPSNMGRGYLIINSGSSETVIITFLILTSDILLLVVQFRSGNIQVIPGMVSIEVFSIPAIVFWTIDQMTHFLRKIFQVIICSIVFIIHPLPGVLLFLKWNFFTLTVHIFFFWIGLIVWCTGLFTGFLSAHDTLNY